MTQLEVVGARWNALLDELGLTDAYLRREYVESAAVLEPGTPTLLHADGVVFACLVRELAGGRADVITPYGYGGPVGAAGGAFAASYEQWCRDRGVVTTFVRFHPLYANERLVPGFDVVPLGGTVAWRLDGDVRECMHRHHRRVVRKAEGAGVAARVQVGPNELDEFAALYERTMERRGATEFYRFSPAYWQALTALRERLLVVEARRGDELLAAVVCLEGTPWLHYHLGASSDAGRRLGASNLAFVAAAEWARAEGHELFHLGGGVGGREDSLLEFKLRFDPGGRRAMHVGKAVHDGPAYRELSGTDDTDGFFPAYRRRREAARGGNPRDLDRSRPADRNRSSRRARG